MTAARRASLQLQQVIDALPDAVVALARHRWAWSILERAQIADDESLRDLFTELMDRWRPDHWRAAWVAYQRTHDGPWGHRAVRTARRLLLNQQRVLSALEPYHSGDLAATAYAAARLLDPIVCAWWDNWRRSSAELLDLVSRLLPYARAVALRLAIARTALEFVPAGEDRPARAVAAIEDWLQGRGTLAETRAATWESDRLALSALPGLPLTATEYAAAAVARVLTDAWFSGMTEYAAEAAAAAGTPYNTPAWQIARDARHAELIALVRSLQPCPLVSEAVRAAAFKTPPAGLP